jgi:REP element-mobilizing transposase RayT
MSGEARSEVLEVIRNDDGVRCRVDAAVVMDDHVHVLATFAHRVPSAKLVHGWKSISSHRLCKLARSAPLWQAEYYLRWLADPVAVAACTAYIRANPTRRWPGVVSYPWLLP